VRKVAVSIEGEYLFYPGAASASSRHCAFPASKTRMFFDNRIDVKPQAHLRLNPPEFRDVILIS
jgi:hypothetical protein